MRASALLNSVARWGYLTSLLLILSFLATFGSSGTWNMLIKKWINGPLFQRLRVWSYFWTWSNLLAGHCSFVLRPGNPSSSIPKFSSGQNRNAKAASSSSSSVLKEFGRKALLFSVLISFFFLCGGGRGGKRTGSFFFYALIPFRERERREKLIFSSPCRKGEKELPFTIRESRSVLVVLESGKSNGVGEKK